MHGNTFVVSPPHVWGSVGLLCYIIMLCARMTKKVVNLNSHSNSHWQISLLSNYVLIFFTMFVNMHCIVCYLIHCILINCTLMLVNWPVRVHIHYNGPLSTGNWLCLYNAVRTRRAPAQTLSHAAPSLNNSKSSIGKLIAIKAARDKHACRSKMANKVAIRASCFFLVFARLCDRWGYAA